MADEFDWETGLFSGVGLITEEWFAVSEGGGNLNLYHKVVGEDGGEGVDCRYGCGPDWGSFDGGETAEHPKGEGKRFNVNTAVAELFRAAFEAGAEDVLRKRSQDLYGGKGPQHAKLMHGLRFRYEVKSEPYSFKNRETGELVEGVKSRSLPVEFLGEGDAPAAVVAPAQGTAPAPEAAPADSGDPLAGLSAEEVAKVKVLAKTLPYPEWVDKVMELPNAVASPTLMVALGDEALYTTLKEG